MTITTKQILAVLKIFAWITYLGLCIKTGAIIISFGVSLYNPEAVGTLYLGEDLSQVYEAGLWEYIALNSFMIILPALKASMFYLVIELLSGINMVQPFSEKVGSLLIRISRVALEIGILAVISNEYAKELIRDGINFSYEGTSGEYLFLAGIVFVIAQIFKRGLELQTENELTV